MHKDLGPAFILYILQCGNKGNEIHLPTIHLPLGFLARGLGRPLREMIAYGAQPPLRPEKNLVCIIYEWPTD
jgi:hypothetical protein